ncbi:MAG: HAD-IIA family hydrolase [Candidatus ainarchaeum sp.]|nr:HAD-IIA family hydrolase [Candidatus ainarchaeum sp.]
MPIKTIIFDLDGVLYRGEQAISGSQDALKKIRNSGKQLFFLTNAGTMSRKDRAERLRKFGFEVQDDEVFTSSYGVAHYISNAKRNSSVYCIGEAGLKEELSSFGIFLTEQKPDFVVVGLDRAVTYARIAKAYRLISSGSKFIATNMDSTFPVEDGLLPGAGTIVHALEYSTGIKPLVIGKPSMYLLDMILKKCGNKKEEILFVGDRIETDILMAKKAGILSALVLSGVCKKEDLKKISKDQKPDYIFNSVSDLVKIL